MTQQILSLQDLVVTIVNDNSGGIKFTELMYRILEKQHEGLILSDTHTFVTPDLLEKCIRKSRLVKILDYVWVPQNRAKMFVYTST
jgi:hypothetical protein